MGNILSFAAALLRPWIIRGPLVVVTVLGFYDVCCNQFGWPKIPKIWGATGSLLSWWGWLLASQPILIAALFEYVRRRLHADTTRQETNFVNANYNAETQVESAEIACDQLKRNLENQFSVLSQFFKGKVEAVELVQGARGMLQRLPMAFEQLDATKNALVHRVENMRQACRQGLKPETARWLGDQQMRLVAWEIGIKWPNSMPALQPVDTYGMENDEYRKIYIRFATELQIALHRAEYVRYHLTRLQEECHRLVKDVEDRTIPILVERAKPE